MSSDINDIFERIAEYESKIKDLETQKSAIEAKRSGDGKLSPEDEINLEEIQEMLSLHKETLDRCQSLAIRYIRCLRGESRSFTEAAGPMENHDYIFEVTGTTLMPVWSRQTKKSPSADPTVPRNGYEYWDHIYKMLNDDPGMQIMPRDGFQTRFREMSDFVDLRSQIGKRMIVTMILTDILARPEFERMLIVRSELPISVETAILPSSGKTSKSNLSKKNKYQDDAEVTKKVLHGDLDVTVGYSNYYRSSILDATLMVVSVVPYLRYDDKYLLISQAASLFKYQSQTPGCEKRVWGVLTDVKTWLFLCIPHDGKIWVSDDIHTGFSTFSPSYDESHIPVYRTLYWIVKQGFEMLKSKDQDEK